MECIDPDSETVACFCSTDPCSSQPEQLLCVQPGFQAHAMLHRSCGHRIGSLSQLPVTEDPWAALFVYQWLCHLTFTSPCSKKISCISFRDTDVFLQGSYVVAGMNNRESFTPRIAPAPSDAAWTLCAQHLKGCKIYSLSVFLLPCLTKAVILLSCLLLGLSYWNPERALHHLALSHSPDVLVQNNLFIQSSPGWITHATAWDLPQEKLFWPIMTKLFKVKILRRVGSWN